MNPSQQQVRAEQRGERRDVHPAQAADVDRHRAAAPTEQIADLIAQTAPAWAIQLADELDEHVVTAPRVAVHRHPQSSGVDPHPTPRSPGRRLRLRQDGYGE